MGGWKYFCWDFSGMGSDRSDSIAGKSGSLTRGRQAAELQERTKERAAA
jgi:hypothetical protein